MSLSVKYLYEFGEYRLDTEEKVLLRGEEHLELTPKAFELLTFFIENPGRLLKKNEIMEKVWADSFVEDSNLTFNIGQLRKILGDNAQQPIFIKTVRQHGYRFIAPVKDVVRKEPAADPIEDLSPKPVEEISKLIAKPTENSLLQHISKPSFLFVALAILLISGLALTLILNGNFRNNQPNAPILSTSFASEKLSENGKVFNAILSPDGKSVVYSNGSPGEKQSIWIRQLEDGSNIEIIPPSENNYVGTKFSPDGKTLYFARASRQTNEPANIYKVSVFGGIPQKITTVSEGWFGISPDGTKMSFVRCPYRDDEFCSVWIADSSDGKNERKLAIHPRPFRIGDNQISPDGKKIAIAAGQSNNASNEFGIIVVDIESGKEQELTKENFFNIKNLGWLPDQSGILMTARKNTDRHFRIWQVSTATGKSFPLTKDSETYSIISLDKDATKLVSTQIKQDFHLSLINAENPEISKTLTSANAVTFAPDGKIIFSSLMSGNAEIWSINADGSGQRQLTNNVADETVPVVSPDNNSIFFASNQTGAAELWRMNSDGSNQTQITKKDGGPPIFVSADGEWVYYVQSISAKLWRVSLKNNEEQLVLDKAKGFFGISPDGLQVAFSENQGDERNLTIANLADGQIKKTFHLADNKLRLKNIVWMPDGKSLLYVTDNQENDNDILWRQFLDGADPHQITALNNENKTEKFSVSISPDSKTIAIVQGKWLHDVVLIKGLK